MHLKSKRYFSAKKVTDLAMLQVGEEGLPSYPNILTAWQHFGTAIRTQDMLLIPNPSITGGKAGDLMLKVGTLHKRVLTLVDAFINELKMSPGDRVVVLTEDPEDLAVILHACWLTRQVVIPIDPDLPPDLSFDIFENCNVKTVIFPPELAARIAHSISKARAVKHWLVSGNATMMPVTNGIKRLDKIMAGAAGGPPPDIKVTPDDCLALICLIGGESQIRGVSFTQGQLISAAASASSLYPRDGFKSMGWSMLGPQTFNTILHTYLVPLYSGSPALLKFRVEPRGFWDNAARNEISWAMVDQEQLAAMKNRSKTKIGVEVSRFRMYVTSHKTLSAPLLADFKKHLPIKLLTCYSQTEAGGIVTAFPDDLPQEEVKKLLCSGNIPSSGIALPGVDIKVVDNNGKALGFEAQGQVSIKSNQCMNSYMGTQPGEVSFNNDGYLLTKDRGYLACDSLGRQHLYVVGRM